jgi:amino acid transporter
MVDATIFQNWVFKDYILPFLLIFALVFGVLEKTKLLGEGKKQVNAIISFVMAMIFVSVLYPKQIVSNMVLFLAVSLVVVLVFLMLYGLVVADKKEGLKVETWMKWVFGILAGVAVIIAVIWASGIQIETLNLLFGQSWSKTFWSNFFFILIVAVALALVMKSQKTS